MKLLLDTHVVLWWRTDSPRLKPAVRRAIGTADIVWVSAASGWEIAIKQSLGKLRMLDSFAAMVADSDFLGLPITLQHAARVAELPDHHTDPFDRMLIAQAGLEGATIITRDSQFEAYDVPLLRT